MFVCFLVTFHPSALGRGAFFVSSGILNFMPLPQTIIATPEWIASQDPTEWLTDDELAAWASWRFPKRRTEWLAGRLASKKLVQDTLGLGPREFTVGREGDAPCLIGPILPEISLSLSHSAGLGAATHSDKILEGTAGIDVQRVRPVHTGLGVRVFTAAERRQIAAHFGSEEDLEGMLLLWALKEAAIKARRIAWGRSLQDIEVRLAEGNKAMISMTGEKPMAAAYAWLDGWWLARAVRMPDTASTTSNNVPVRQSSLD
jgi:phosphopantetheinyl transferase